MTKNNELEIKIFENTGALIFKMVLAVDKNVLQMLDKFALKAIDEIHSEYDNKESSFLDNGVKELGKWLSDAGKKELKPAVIAMSDIPSDVIESIKYFAKYHKLETRMFLGICLHRVVRRRYIELIKYMEVGVN